MSFASFVELTIALLYFTGSLLYLAGVIGQKAPVRKAAMAATILGFALHSVDLAATLVIPGHASLFMGRFYVSLLAWSLLLLYLLMAWRLKLQFLTLTAAPLALVLFLSSFPLSGVRIAIPRELSLLWFGMHVVSNFLSIALLALAFGAGIAYLFLERKIKGKANLSGWTNQLPSLTAFDRVNHFAAMIGFPLYTVGLLSGFLWAKLTWNRIFSWDPKEIASLLIWFVFALFFNQRVTLGWKGRKPAKLAIWIFFFTLVSLLGINFFMPTHHSFNP
jgi:ABC-type transport system involved in cytochrome c biogenesis permease subunit